LGLAMSFVLFYGGFKVLQGKMLLSNFVAFQLYLVHMDWPLMAFGWFIQLFRQSQASQKRVQALQEISNPLLLASPDEPSNVSDSIEFEIKNISYRYENQRSDLFQSLNLKLKGSQWIGLTGAVGSGKSTLLELLSRQRDPVSGDIYFSGINLKSKSFPEWTKEILYVPQEAFMFSRSIRRNLTLGLKVPPPDTALWELLSDLSFNEELLNERGGLETKLGERGANLSGGQRQRLSLGRALIRERKVYLLDDLFSHVDSETEAKLLSALRKRISKDALVILVSQRLETLLTCNELVILSKSGDVEYQGPPKMALEQSPFIKRLLELQDLERIAG
jgi:ATP-binding cassette subfamily B multidrug efflux pump